MAVLDGSFRTRNSSDNKCNKQFYLSLAEISSQQHECLFVQHRHGNLQGKTGREAGRHIRLKLFIFLHSKTLRRLRLRFRLRLRKF